MQSVILLAAVAAVFVFGYFVARAWGNFLEENQAPQEQKTDSGPLENEVEKQAGK